jgi:hypothetical protein
MHADSQPPDTPLRVKHPVDVRLRRQALVKGETDIQRAEGVRFDEFLNKKILSFLFNEFLKIISFHFFDQ